MCVWIDRHRAKVFDLDRRAEQADIIDATDGRADHVRIGELRLSRSYLAAIARALAGAGEILILGPDGTRILFAGWLYEERPHLTRRIVASAPCDRRADGEILACAHSLLKTARTTDA